MYKIFFSLVLLFFSVSVFSQDIIANQDNDTAETVNSGVISQEVELEKKNPRDFRLALAGGYFFRTGRTEKSGDVKLDNISSDLSRGLGLDVEVQYFFKPMYGIALNFNHNRSSAKEKNVSIPFADGDVYCNQYNEIQTTTFIGPAFAMRHETKKTLFTASVALGPLFFRDEMKLSASQGIGSLVGTTTTFGVNVGIGLEYKLSQKMAAGVKLSQTGGTINSIKISGVKYDYEEALSIGSLMLSGYVSFRTF